MKPLNAADTRKTIRNIDKETKECENNDFEQTTYSKGGLANSLHGNIYQLKLQMLFLKRALDKDYIFQLGTEVEDAGKFDDIVFKYMRKNESGNFEVRFVQAKHKNDESKKITASDLLTLNDTNDFCLLKYFISFCKINRNPEFIKSKLKDFIIYTNIDFDYDSLKSSSLDMKIIEEHDDILKITKSSKMAKRYKLQVSQGHKIYDMLGKTTDMHLLAKELHKHLSNNRILNLTGIFEVYHYVLTKKILYLKKSSHTAYFRDDFLIGENLSEDIIKFRHIFMTCLNLKSTCAFQKDLSQKKVSVSKTFAQLFNLDANPNITDTKNFAKIFVDIVINARNRQEYIIPIDRRKSDIIDSNINKLGFRVFVKDEVKELVRFGKMFFDEKRKLMGNLEELRYHLKSVLQENGLELITLSEYKFKINRFHTCREITEGILSYPKALPNECVEEKKIEDFIDKLVFAVNQPNEEELGEIITSEMTQSSAFNLLDANLISSSFQNKLLDWFKHKRPEKGKEGVWLDAKSGKEFIDSIDHKVKILISVGISLAYPEKLASYGIKFNKNITSKKIIAFISDNNYSKNIIHVKTSESTLLSAINVYSTMDILKEQAIFARYQKNDSYIFMRLDTLLGENVQSYVLDAFNSIDSYHLLIIDCSVSSDLLRHIDKVRLCDKLSDILSKMKKKIIFISHDKNDICDYFPDDLKASVVDEAIFVDLTDESKMTLLQKPILFQGHKVCLNALINQSNTDVKELIDTKTIIKLLNNEDIIVSSELNDLGATNDYYITRKFRPVAISRNGMEKYLKTADINSDIFVINGDVNGLEHHNIYTFNSTQLSEMKFNELRIKNTDSNIHWLESDSNIFTLYKSHGSISNLIPYRIQEDLADTVEYKRLLKEPDLIDENNHLNNFFIISDTAGMGKSTVLTNLSIMLKNDRSLWVIRINLNDYTDILDTEKRYREKIESGVQYNENMMILLIKLALRQSESLQNFELEKRLFTYNLNKHGKIAFLFDGFDEISPDYKEIALDLLKFLRKLNVRNIFVTTRPNFRQELEVTLEVFALFLDPFSKENQIEFLSKFWSTNLELKNQHADKLKTYVESTIQQVCGYIHDEEQRFISIPLQLMMVAEVFQENKPDFKTSEWQSCKEFLKSEQNVPEIMTNFSLNQLYEKFVQNKFYNFYLRDKKRRILTIVGERKSAEDDYKKYKEENGLLALQLLFNNNELTKILSTNNIEKLADLIEEVEKGEHNKGIVDGIINGKPHFIHRTFAEYFASFLVAEKMLEAPSDVLKCINNILLNMSPIFMHSIIDELTGKYSMLTSILKKPLLHYVLDESCSNILKFLIKCNHNVWQKKLDVYGKTPLHYAVEHNHAEVIIDLHKYVDDIYGDEILKHGKFKYPEYENSALIKFINLRDNDNKTALFYAIQQNNLDVAFELILKGADIHVLSEDNINKLIHHMINDRRKHILAYAKEDNKYRPLHEKLFLRAPNIFNTLNLYEQSRILSFFFLHGRVEVVDALLTTIDSKEKRKQVLNNPDNGQTPLDRVLGGQLSDDTNLEILKYLNEHDGFPTNLTNDSSNCPIMNILYYAALHGHIKTLKYFINLKKHNKHNSIMHCALDGNKEVIVKYLNDHHKKDIHTYNGNTPLHYACSTTGAKLEIIKYLIMNGDINAANDMGETPLHMAINANRRINVIEYLINNGADIDFRDISGNTPLSVAIESDRDDLTFCLLKYKATIPPSASQLLKIKLIYFTNPNGCNLDFTDKHGYPRLHIAIMTGQYGWATFLIRHGADVNREDSNGNSCLHLYNCTINITIFELLLQYGAIFDKKNKRNQRPRDLITQLDNPAFWLLRVLGKLFSSRNLMHDLNEELLECNHETFNQKNWGPYGHGYPDVWDTRNPTQYILNARNNQGKHLLHIAAENNDVEAFNTLTNFNDDYLDQKIKSRKDRRYRDYQPTSFDVIDSQMNSPLHCAAEKGSRDIVQSLLQKGATFNRKNSKGKTPEELASENNHTDIVQMLQSTKNLHISLSKEDIINIENCVKTNAFVNAKNENGENSLHLAADTQYKQIVELLLDHGADVTATDTNGDTPLHVASKNNKLENVKILLKYGAIYDIENKFGQTPKDLSNEQNRELLEIINCLFKAILSDEPYVIINTLRKYNKDFIVVIVNSSDKEGNTLLHYAAELGDIKIVEFLLEVGSVFNPENKFKETPVKLTRAQDIKTLLGSIENMFQNIQNIHEEMKTVNYKIVKNVLNRDRNGLLHYAIAADEKKIIKLLTNKIEYK